MQLSAVLAMAMCEMHRAPARVADAEDGPESHWSGHTAPPKVQVLEAGGFVEAHALAAAGCWHMFLRQRQRQRGQVRD